MAGMIFITIFFSVLFVTSICFNVIVFYVIVKSKQLHTSQFVYMATIALSNTLTTLVVHPSVLAHMWLLAGQPLDDGHVTDYREKLSRAYIETLGAGTMLPVCVSIYTLIVATGDRLYAITWPLKYHRRNSLGRTHKICTSIWLSATFVALFPVLTRPHVRYDLQTLVWVTIAGRHSNVIYVVVLCVPMFLLWVMSFVTYNKAGAGWQVREVEGATTRRRQSIRNANLQKCMTKTLVNVVGSWTVSILPLACLLVVGLIDPDVNLNSRRKLRSRGLTPLFVVEWFAFMSFTLHTLWCFVVLNKENRQFRRAKANLLCCYDSKEVARGSVAKRGSLLMSRQKSNYPSLNLNFEMQVKNQNF